MRLAASGQTELKGSKILIPPEVSLETLLKSLPEVLLKRLSSPLKFQFENSRVQNSGRGLERPSKALLKRVSMRFTYKEASRQTTGKEARREMRGGEEASRRDGGGEQARSRGGEEEARARRDDGGDRRGEKVARIRRQVN